MKSLIVNLRIGIICISITSACASVDRKLASDSSAPSIEKTLARDMEERLASLFEKHVIVLDRQLTAFHYSESAQPPHKPQGLDALQSRFARQAAAFDDAKLFDRNLLGPGFYVASDPASTRIDFGGVAPELSVVSIAPQRRILNGSYQLTPDEMKEINNGLEQTGCYGRSGAGTASLSGVISAFRTEKSGQIPCAAVVIGALKRARVSGILYSYPTLDVPGCRFRFQAINLIDPSAFTVVAFYSDLERFATADFATENVARLYDETILFVNDPRDRETRSIRRPKKLTRSKIEEKTGSFRAWKDKSILGCGPRWSLEAPLSANAVADARPPVSFTLLKDLSHALRTATHGKVHRVDGIKAILNLAYEHVKKSQPSLAFEDWLRTYRTLQTYAFFYHDGKGADLVENATAALNEQAPESLLNALDAGGIIADVARSGAISGDRIAQYLESTGLPPRTAETLAAILALGRGIPPAGVDDKVFEERLQTCLAAYSRPSANPETLQGTACGLIESL